MRVSSSSTITYQEKRKPPSAALWALVAMVWHAVLGIGMLLAGLLILPGALSEITAFGIIIEFAEPLVRVGIGVLLLVSGGIQLAFWPALRGYRSRGRVMSLVVNFLCFVVLLFLTFRQMTCQGNNICTADPSIFASDRLATWLPFFGLLLAFGALLYGMWRQPTAALYSESPKLRAALTAYLYISPYLITASVFTFSLMIYAFVLGFTEFTNEQLYGGVAPRWLGLQNYADVIQNAEFQIALSNVIWYSFLVVIFQTIIALGLAVMMNAQFAGRRLFRTLFYAPSVTSSVVISLIFLWLLNGRGIVNYVVFDVLQLTEPLGNLGLRTPNTNWLNTPNRLGDLTYLKPFIDGSWGWLLFIPLLIVILFVVLRLARWLMGNMLNRQVAVVSGLVGFVCAVGLHLLVGEAIIPLMLVTVVAGILSGAAVNLLRMEGDVNTATRSGITGMLVAMIVFGLFSRISASATLAENPSLQYGVLLVPALLGTLVTPLTIRLTHARLIRKSEDARHTHDSETPVSPALERWGQFPSSAVLSLLVIWCIGVLLTAAATMGIADPRDLGNDTFGPLLLRGPSVALMSIMLLNIFTTSPTFMIMFLAALQDIPTSLYEAARVDGASRWQQFWNITLPMLRPVMLLIVVLGTIGTLQIFDQVHVMTAGGPANTTLTPVYLIYTRAIGDQRPVAMGNASAMAFVLGLIIFVFTYIQRRYIERGTEQY